MVLNNCDPEFGLARAEGIRKNIVRCPVQSSAGAIPVTVSIGVLLSHEWEGQPVEELLQKADIALYADKAAGRNCVKLAVPNGLNAPQDFLAAEPARRRP